MKYDGKTIAGIHHVEVEHDEWVPHVLVEHIETAGADASRLGATLVDRHDVDGMARIATMRDREGAAFGLWQAAPNAGAEVTDVLGSIWWIELMTRDPAAGRQNRHVRVCVAQTAIPFDRLEEAGSRRVREAQVVSMQVTFGSLRWFDEDDVRFVPRPIEEQLAAIRGNIEITDRELAAERRQLPLVSSLEIADPQLLVGDVSLQRHQCIVSTEKRDASRPSTQDEFRQRVWAPIRRNGLQQKRRRHVSTRVNQEATRGRPDGIEREALNEEHGCASRD